MASKTPPSEALAAWLPRQRWFAAKSRRIERVDVVDRIPLDGGVVAIVMAHLAGGAADRYAVPLAAGETVADALDDPAFGAALLALVAGGGRAAGERGALIGRRTTAFPAAADGGTHDVRRLGGEQSNTSLRFDDALIMKVFRRLADGVNPDQEIAQYLTERTTFRGTPPLAGVLEYHDAGGAVASFALLQHFVPGARDGWTWMLDELRRFFAAVPASPTPTPAAVRALAGTTLGALERLGARTAELHLALASDRRDPAFAPEPIVPADVTRWATQVRAQLEAARAAAGDRLVGELPDLVTALAGLVGRAKIRHHGDYHLGQTLRVGHLGQTLRAGDAAPRGGGDFMIIDFEGEPLRPLAERRLKHTPLRDVAGMLRSLAYAAAAAPGMRPGWDEAWVAEAGAAFTGGYRAAAGAAPFLPLTDAAFRSVLAVFELEKAAYEIVYEASHRPDWLAIPRRGLISAAAALRAAAAGAA